VQGTVAGEKVVIGGHGVSQLVTLPPLSEAGKAIENIDESHDLALAGLDGTRWENGGSGGARTRNLCRDRAAL
jgi:hypothetical protein